MLQAAAIARQLQEKNANLSTQERMQPTPPSDFYKYVYCNYHEEFVPEMDADDENEEPEAVRMATSMDPSPLRAPADPKDAAAFLTAFRLRAYLALIDSCNLASLASSSASSASNASSWELKELCGAGPSHVTRSSSVTRELALENVLVGGAIAGGVEDTDTEEGQGDALESVVDAELDAAGELIDILISSSKLAIL